MTPQEPLPVRRGSCDPPLVARDPARDPRVPQGRPRGSQIGSLSPEPRWHLPESKTAPAERLPVRRGSRDPPHCPRDPSGPTQVVPIRLVKSQIKMALP